MNIRSFYGLPLPQSRHSRRRRQRAQAGFTLTELLVTAVILSVVMIGLMNIFFVYWNSFYNVVWQNKVDQAARYALDTITDDVRYSTTAQEDGYHPSGYGSTQVDSGSTNNCVSPNIFGMIDPFNADNQYEVVKNPTTGVWGLLRIQNGTQINTIAGYVTNVQFEYEYRAAATQPSSGTATWDFYRTVLPPGYGGSAYDPEGNAPLWVTTIYVTVTSSYTGYNGEVFTRTLTSAVHLRQPVEPGIVRSVS